MNQTHMLLEILKACAKDASAHTSPRPGMPVMPILWSEELARLVRWLSSQDPKKVQHAVMAMAPSAVVTEAIVTRAATYSLSGPYLVIEDWNMTRPHMLVVSDLARTVGRVDRRLRSSFETGLRIRRGMWTVPLSIEQLCEACALGLVANIIEAIMKQSGGKQ